MYSLYGLRVESSQSIPGLISSSESSSPPEVRVIIGTVPQWTRELDLSRAPILYSTPYSDPEGQANLQVWAVQHHQYFLLRYSGGFQFLIDARGENVWSVWPENGSFETACLYLTGPVFGFVLQLRGYTSLHASCVALEGAAVAFVGDCGAGKSTIAAAFAARGHVVMSDDVLTIREVEGTFLAQRGAARIRLWPDSVKLLYGAPDALPRLSLAFDKRYLDVAGEAGIAPVNLPLSAIYFLRERSESDAAPVVGPIKPSDGLMEMVANTYTSYLQDSARRARDFAFLGKVASQIPLRTLTPHVDANRLEDLCKTVLEDFHVNEDRRRPHLVP